MNGCWMHSGGRWRTVIAAWIAAIALSAIGARADAQSAASAAASATAPVPAQASQGQDAASMLRLRHDVLRDALAHNAYNRPLFIESSESSGALRGDVYAVIDEPFSRVGPALQTMDQWCDLLILHLNVKNCSWSGKGTKDPVLSLAVGRKFDQPLDDAYRVNFHFSAPSTGSDYLKVQMSAEDGPLSTRDYRLSLEAVPIEGNRSFVHMSYSYAYGSAARFAMQVYLSTLGRDKVGFSIVGKDGDGKPIYVDGVRGVVERNTMRYYLAIEAYVDALSAPPAAQLDKRLNEWFAATERYPRQLHEMERDEYLTMKHHEVERQKELARSSKPR